MDSKSISQLTTGRAPGQLINFSHIFGVPKDDQFGNLMPKLVWIQYRADEANARILEAFQSWKIAVTSGEGIQRHLFSIEYAIFQLRRLADELIGLCSAMRCYEESARLPEKIEPDRLGALLSRPEFLEREPFTRHRSVLIRLNDISNAHKHSFLSSDTIMIGAQEPVVYALDMKNNDTRNKVMLHSVELRVLVGEFDAFFLDAWSWLKGSSRRAYS